MSSFDDELRARGYTDKEIEDGYKRLLAALKDHTDEGEDGDA